MRSSGLLLLALAGCGGSGSSGSPANQVTVDLLLPAGNSPDPFQNVSTLHVQVSQGGTVVYQNDFGPNVPITVHGLTAGNGRTVLLQGKNAAGSVISHGVTLPFDFTEGQSITVPLYFATSNSFNTVNGGSARVGAASAGFPDGRVLVAGGLDSGGGGLSTAGLYDPLTDTVIAVGAMSTAHAFTAAVLLSTGQVLVAGGTVAATVGPTAAAEVFLYDASGPGGQWASGIPPMSAKRADLGLVSAGGGKVIAAGGDPDGSNALNTFEVFSWNGSSGSWAAGNKNLSAARLGPAAFGSGNNSAVCGGSSGAGATDFSQTCDIFNGDHLGGGFGLNMLALAVGHPGVVPLGNDSWLLLGGDSDGGLSAQTQSVALAGPIVTTTLGPTLASPQKLGGGGPLASGVVITEGGATGTPSALTPVEESQTYNPGSGNFSALGSNPGATTTAAVYPLGDGTSVVVVDSGVMRYNP